MGVFRVAEDYCVVHGGLSRGEARYAVMMAVEKLVKRGLIVLNIVAILAIVGAVVVDYYCW